MPELWAYDHLIEYLAELGYCSNNGMGMGLLSFTEIQSWSLLMQTPVSTFEVESIRRLSAVYVDQKMASDDLNCPPPFSPDHEMTVEKRTTVDSFFRMLARKKKAK